MREWLAPDLRPIFDSGVGGRAKSRNVGWKHMVNAGSEPYNGVLG